MDRLRRRSRLVDLDDEIKGFVTWTPLGQVDLVGIKLAPKGPKVGNKQN